MRKFITILLAFALITVACGGDDAAKDPADIDTCEGLADATIVMLQDVIDVLGDLDAAQMGALMGGETLEAFTPLEATAAAIGTRAGELECTNLNELLVERADDLSAADDNAFGGLIIQGVKDGDEDVLDRLFR